ncbi:MAG: type II toxin-antitoxin system RelE/ParE family toxin [Planctomycetes bacterium]|nr:type II toxin-antitoxin system RelE/ParE family toxin [Planctomycetota bacterium]
MTQRAVEDLDSISAWIESEGTALDAQRWVVRLSEAHATLGVFPDRCPVAPDVPGLQLVLRHLIVGEYRAVFTVRGCVVFVLQVRHGKRRPATKQDLAPALRELRLPPSDPPQ